MARAAVAWLDAHQYVGVAIGWTIAVWVGFAYCIGTASTDHQEPL